MFDLQNCCKLVSFLKEICHTRSILLTVSERGWHVSGTKDSSGICKFWEKNYQPTILMVSGTSAVDDTVMEDKFIRTGIL